MRLRNREPSFPGAETTRIDGWTWELHSDWKNDLETQHLENPELLTCTTAEAIVRNPPGRLTSVFRVRLSSSRPAIYVKRYHSPGFTAGVKAVFRRSRALRAFRLAFLLRQLGIQTAPPVAAGERRVLGWLNEAYLITQELPDVMTWFVYDEGFPHGRHRVSLLRELARVFGVLHDAGYSHSDANRNNLLVRLAEGGKPELYLIDLDAVVPRYRIDESRVLKDLQRLMVRGAWTHREGIWFLIQYCRARRGRVYPRGLASRLVRQIARKGPAPGAASEYDASQAGLRWLIRPLFLTASVEKILNAPDQFLAQGQVLNPSHDSKVTAGEGYVLKRFRYRKWSNRCKDALRGSRGVRCFWHALVLESIGIATARPIGAAERRRLGVARCSYFLMAEVPGARTLAEWRGDQRLATIRLADLIANLHSAGFFHGDLKDGHILLDAEARPHLIDLGSLSYAKELADARVAADLATLRKSCAGWKQPPPRTVLLRFLKRYCRRRRRSDVRWWWKAVAKL